VVGGFSDNDGYFTLELPPGSYKVTASGIPENRFRLFLTLAENGPVPDRIDLLVESKALCVGDLKLPRLVSSPRLGYPAAASAVHAVGTVNVEIEIGPDGTVTSAKAIRGHPLLRPFSESASKLFKFELGSSSTQLTGILQFVFVDKGIKEKNVERFACQSRVIIVREPPVLNITETKAAR
jgi:hypothetical protein